MAYKVKVLIVDDSAVIRSTLSDIISKESWIELTGTAIDPYAAVKKIATEKPDVIILDIEMPKMNGLAFLRKLMSQHPIPVIIFSSIAEKGSIAAIKALEYGAMEVIRKPESIDDLVNYVTPKLKEAIKASAQSKIKRKYVQPSVEPFPTKKNAETHHSSRIIAIGASTGGTTAIAEILQQVKANCYGIVIVQHMPEFFTYAFAERVNQFSTIHVKEARHGDEISKGRALVAPGNKHLEVRKVGLSYFVELHQQEPVNRHRPSVDVLFSSMANCVGKNGVGILLTGMGDDGAKGLLRMKQAGADTVAQDEETSAVFGMPKEAIELNAARRVMSLQYMAQYINTLA